MGLSVDWDDRAIEKAVKVRRTSFLEVAARYHRIYQARMKSIISFHLVMKLSH
jgi:hypothetical protein